MQFLVPVNSPHVCNKCGKHVHAMCGLKDEQSYNLESCFKCSAKAKKQSSTNKALVKKSTNKASVKKSSKKNIYEMRYEENGNSKSSDESSADDDEEYGNTEEILLRRGKPVTTGGQQMKMESLEAWIHQQGQYPLIW